MQILFLPFAGGNANSYNKIFDRLRPKHLPIAFDTPGKGQRIKEPLLKNIHLLVEEYLAQFKTKMQPPYAIFGHSMGAYLGHLLIHKMQEQNLPLPQHFFVSSKLPPNQNKNKKRHLLADADFVNSLNKLGGIPQPILENKVILNIFLPMIKADFYAIDHYNYLKKEPYPVPLSVFAGQQENAPEELLKFWQQETTLPIVQFQRFKGGHFWLFEHAELLCKTIDSTLTQKTA